MAVTLHHVLKQIYRFLDYWDINLKMDIYILGWFRSPFSPVNPLQMGLALLPFTAISTGTERTKPVIHQHSCSTPRHLLMSDRLWFCLHLMVCFSAWLDAHPLASRVSFFCWRWCWKSKSNPEEPDWCLVLKHLWSIK